VADGAHNPDGVAALVSSLAGLERPAPRVGVFAIMADKAVDDMLARLAPLVDVVVCTQASEARTLTAGELARHVNEVRGRPDGRRETGATMRGGARPGRAEPAGVAGAAGPVHEAAPPPAVYEEADPHAAVALARRLAGGGGSVLVAGSLYLLADLADLLEGGGAESGGVY